MKQKNEVFLYDNIYFENGKKDMDEHPIVVVGYDDKDLYCFTMTSQTKHDYKNSPERNTYNQNVKYIKTIPGKNITVKNNKEGLINTTYCFTVPIEDSRLYSNFGFVGKTVAQDIIVRWAYQQNEIKDKRDWNYNKICSVFGINDNIKSDPMYVYTQTLMNNYPKELERQRKYAKELRIYLEERYKIKRENQYRYQNHMPALPYPSEPQLESDKDYLEAYSHKPSNSIEDSPFAELAKKFEEEEKQKEALRLQEEQRLAQEKESEQRIQTLKQEINNDIIVLQEYKRQMLQKQQEQNNIEYFNPNEETYEEERSVGRRAA